MAGQGILAMKQAFSISFVYNTVFTIWLTWMVSFDSNWNSHYDGKGLAGQFWQMESALKDTKMK